MLVDEVVVSIIKKRMSEYNINPMSCSDPKSVEPPEASKNIENIRNATEFNNLSGFCIFSTDKFNQLCHLSAISTGKRNTFEKHILEVYSGKQVYNTGCSRQMSTLY